MRSLVLRTLGGLVAAGVGLGVAATPAAATEASTARPDAGVTGESSTSRSGVRVGPTSTFRLVAGGVVAQGTYQHLTGTPAQPGPPVRINGTLVGRKLFGCAVIQVAQSGPADGLEWKTFGRHCGPGRSPFRIEASYLFRGVKPPVRLCAGRTLPQAERGGECNEFRPPAAG